MDMRKRLKSMLGIELSDTTRDELLDYLVDDAINEIITYCNLKSYDEKLNSIVIKMVLQNYNKVKIQGITSHSYSGVSESYTDGYTADVMAQMNKHRRVRFL